MRTGHGIHRVNLLFDRETDHVAVESPYTHDGLRVTVRTAGPLYVRIPSWVKPSDVLVEPVPPRLTWSGSYLLIAEPPVGQGIDIRFPLAEREIVLHHRTRDIRVRLRGDAVAAMENHGADLTYFEPL